MDRNERSLTELRAEAKSLGITGYSRMTKDELLQEMRRTAAAAGGAPAAATAGTGSSEGGPSKARGSGTAAKAAVAESERKRSGRARAEVAAAAAPNDRGRAGDTPAGGARAGQDAAKRSARRAAEDAPAARPGSHPTVDAPAENTAIGMTPSRGPAATAPPPVAHHEGRFPGSAMGAADSGRYSPDVPGALPTSYGEDRLVLMARDPEWLFAYWEIRPETAQQAMRDLEESVPVLRVSYRATEGGGDGRSYDERVDLFARRHYLHVPEAHHVYRAELGFRSRDGRFVAALRSNEVFAPPEDVSPAVEEQFATLPWNVPLEEGMRAAKVSAPRPPTGERGERGVPGLSGAPVGSSELASRGGAEGEAEEARRRRKAREERPTSGEWPTSPGRRS